MRFIMVTTNCLTGEANYFEEKKDKKRVIDIVKASSSLPFVSPVTYVDNLPMLDGGIVDSIPLEQAMKEGFKKNVVILTRPKGYRKEGKDIKIPSFIYRKYPKLRDVLSSRNAIYNRQLELIDEYEEKGLIFTLRPSEEIEVNRLEKDVKKLEAIYEEGYECAVKVFGKEKR